MPTKTVIFSQLSKYDGQQTRYLLDMNIRNKLVGLDDEDLMKKVVIHLNNLFEMPACQDYRDLVENPSLIL